jgi:MFS superfamily sulfate permease-like transporter
MTAQRDGRGSPQRESLAGVASALSSLPLNIAHGAIAFAPLGAAGVVAGAASTVMAAGLGGILLGLLAGSRPLTGGPSAAVSLTVAGVLSAAIATGAVPTGPEGIGAAVLLAGLLTLCAGLLVGGLALLRLGRLATLVPYPVLSGFLNGTAVLLVLSQLGPMLGQPVGRWPDWAEARPLAVLVALAGAAAMILPVPAPLRAVPAVLRALVVGWAADAALRLAGLGGLLGPLLGAPPTLAGHVADVEAGLAAWSGLALLPLLPMIAAAAATIAVLVVIETLGTAAALREMGQPRADLDRDLQGLAVANLAAGAAGGVGVCGSLSATKACHAAGGVGRLATVMRGATLLSVLAVLGPAVALVPQAVLAGVVLGTAWLLADAGTLRPLRAGAGRSWADALVMLAVAGLAVAWSLAAAVGIGVVLAVLTFAASMRRGVVRRAWRNPAGRSRTRRSARAEAVLLAAGDRIEVVELEGALFFGSADAVALHVERAVASGARFVILDLGRVTRVDLSGGRQLLRLVATPPRAGTRVLLAGLRPAGTAGGDLAALALLGAVPPETRFDTLEAALAWVEAGILAEADPAAAEDRADPAALLRDLGVAEELAGRLLARMAAIRFESGAAVIRAGDPPDALYLLLSGIAEISLPRPGGALRVASLAPGAIFGEMAVLTGARRSADVIARTALDCLRLDAADLARLEEEEPRAAAALLRAIARQLDSNLRLANSTIAALEG